MARRDRPYGARARARALALALGAGAWLAGCAAPAPGPSALVPGPDDLAYGLPTATPVFYTVADTATFMVDPGAMGRMSVSAAYTGTAEVDMGAGPEVLEARIRFHRLRGTFETQGQPPQPVDGSDLEGEFVLTVDALGRTEVLEAPVLSPRLLDVTSAEALVRPLFVRLPGRPAGPGDVWVDTIVAVEDRADSRSRVRTVITTTLIGDTVRDGRTLLLLRTRAENRLEMEGRSGGVLVRQLLTGTTHGTVLWDPYFRMVVDRTEDGHLSGAMDLPGAGVADLPLTARVRRHVRLEGVGAPEPEGAT